jgi:hypothetical protein
MVTAGIADHPAAEFCVNLSIGGFTDWYMPSRQELDIAYFNLKPGTQTNDTNWGANIYAVPQRNSSWTAAYPTQTALTLFNTSTEAFVVDYHWSSTETASFASTEVRFSVGNQNTAAKSSLRRVRAFRRIAL